MSTNHPHFLVLAYLWGLERASAAEMGNEIPFALAPLPPGKLQRKQFSCEHAKAFRMAFVSTAEP